MILDNIRQDVLKLSQEAEADLKDIFKEIDDICLYNSNRILSAFIDNKIEYADSFKDLQYYLVCDVLDYMIIGVEKTLNQVKKELLED